MAPKYSVLAFTVALFVSPTLHAASGASTEQEYQQVRKIALRDAKVKAAYEDADRKLEAKILQIDPALADYLRRRTGETEVPKASTMTKPAPAPGGFHTTHTVIKGETLGGIASHYSVTVAALKTANHIEDEKKLAVGQVLNIPSAGTKR
jgi:LysM repeat protein